jgi:hypothetical protein
VAELRRMADGGTITTDVEVPAEARNGKPERGVNVNGNIKEVRSSDIEPYTGLRYLSKLFRFMAIILLLLLVAEVVTGVYTQGSASIPTLLGEASRLVVLAGVLWGTGDLAHLLIDVGHDVRAARILVARVAHAAKVAPLTSTRTRDQTMADRITAVRVQADRVDNGDEGPPIP